MTLPNNLTERAAVFSPCNQYRYWLRRTFDFGCRPCIWIMLNPSRATATRDDSTTSLCMNYAKRWRYTDHIAVNLFALIDTYPSGLCAVDDPVGPDNDEAIMRAVDFGQQYDGLVIAAWGNHGRIADRAKAVLTLLSGVDLYTLGLTKIGEPHFPRALSRTVMPQRLVNAPQPVAGEKIRDLK